MRISKQFGSRLDPTESQTSGSITVYKGHKYVTSQVNSQYIIAIFSVLLDCTFI